MTSANSVGEQRVVLENVSWLTYVSLLDDSRRSRMTYDRGTLEIMSPSKSHENIGRLIGRMVEAFTEERLIEIVSVASTTVKLEMLEKGFEADEAYYIGHADAVRSKSELDFAVDPVPDLVIVVDVSRSSMGKLPIFAAFRVPEVWQYRGDALRLLALSDGSYVEQKQSSVLPGFPVAAMIETLSHRSEVGETELIRRFRGTCRQDAR
ncbi:MAG: Uma2 family endonuclease [Pirellulaceae bacterium]|nr:Uma2 family endonuclease [Planctomycetales bacterium]